MTARRRLGRYELLAPIARGGMAVVWAAREAGSDSAVPTFAIKTLLAEHALDHQFEQMFLAEARLAAKIKHPNVCSVLESGEDSGTLFLAMEWLSGESLAVLLGDSGGRLPFGIAVRIALDVARGLQAAHGQTSDDGSPLGIVHRDVSPQNIVVTSSGVAKILDFGVAKAKAVEERLTQSGHLKGKVGYMSPEQVYCEEVDARSDVFALGVVLYEATTGKHPFSAGAQLGTLLNISGPEPAASPSTVVGDYPDALERLVMTAIDKDPERRFSTMNDFAAALELVLAELGTDHDDVCRQFAETMARRAELRDAQIRKGGPRDAELLSGLEPQGPSAARRSRVAWLALALIPVGLVLGLALSRGSASESRETSAPRPPASFAEVAAQPVKPPLPEAPTSAPALPSARPPERSAPRLPRAPKPKPHEHVELQRPLDDVLKSRE